MKTLNLIGAGRVGQTLGHLFAAAGIYQVQAVLTRSEASTRRALDFIASGEACSGLSAMPAADLWLLAVPDTQIAPLAQSLAALKLRPGLAFHCSGALGCDQLQALSEQGWQVASVHPLLSFAEPQRALAQFSGTPCAVEAQTEASVELTRAFSALGGQCFTLAAQDKLLYHAGAVFATNFLPVLQDLAEQLWQCSGMPVELIQQMRRSLLQNAVNNIVALGPLAALTGPASRGDTVLVERQAQAVSQWQAEAGAAYTALSRLAEQLARRPQGSVQQNSDAA